MKRHRRKFVVSGAVIGGGYFFFKYGLRRVREWEEKEVAGCYEMLKKEQHFETTLRTCNDTISSLAANLKSNIVAMLDSDAMTDVLKMKPSNKLEVWDELKIIGFARPLTLIYSSSLLIIFMNVQMSILGGYIYVETAKGKNGGESIISPQMQTQFLSIVEHFLDDGLKTLVAALTSVVKDVVGPLSLKEQLPPSQVENIFQQIKRQFEESDANPGTRLPQFLLSSVRFDCGVGDANSNLPLQKIIDETADVLASEDCQQIFASVVHSGFAMLADSVTGCYVDSSRDKSQQFVNPQDVEVPLAKLIPFLCNLIHVQCSSQKGELLHNLAHSDTVKLFAANIYEAFSSVQGDKK